MAKSPIKVPKNTLTPNEGQLLSVLLQEQNIVPNHKTILLIGDGSGSGWNMSCGWASVSIDWKTRERKVWYGYACPGSVNLAEGMAYLHPLCWLVNQEVEAKNNGEERRGPRVHVITDSQYIRDLIKKSDRTAGANSPMGSVFDCVNRQGIVIIPHWVERLKIDLNRYTDALSRFVRESLKNWKAEQELTRLGDGVLGFTPYDFNPDAMEGG